MHAHNDMALKRKGNRQFKLWFSCHSLRAESGSSGCFSPSVPLRAMKLSTRAVNDNVICSANEMSLLPSKDLNLLAAAAAHAREFETSSHDTSDQPIDHVHESTVCRYTVVSTLFRW